MATHEELVCEMPQLEGMSIQERLKHAKKRRNQQLKRYQQYERDIQRKTKKLQSQRSAGGSPAGARRSITFAENVQLLEAAARGDTVEVKTFLESGVDPNTGNEDGLTALHQSCIDNREDMMKILLDHGADVNIKDREMWTPLHAASTCGHKALAQSLIARGADLLSINSDGNMPYDICEDEETLDYIESQMAAQGITQDQIDDLREVAPNRMLTDMKQIQTESGDLEYKDESGATPLHIAVAQGFEKVVIFLLESKVNVNAKDNDGWQPIHAASCWAQAEIIQILVEHGANLDSRTDNNETPLMICEEDDIKTLIHQLKTETLKRQGNKLTRNGSSQKKRGSTIRRSKRDKSEMSKMDAKGEAAFIQSREVPATNIDDVIMNGLGDESKADDKTTAAAAAAAASPDVILTDETLPESKLSSSPAEEKEEERGDEEKPAASAAPPPDRSPDVEVEVEDPSHPSSAIEQKRPKSILKRSSLPAGEEDRQEAGREPDRGPEQKQKERQQRELEKQRSRDEKERRRQLERDEKQRRKKEQAVKKQKKGRQQSQQDEERGDESIDNAERQVVHKPEDPPRSEVSSPPDEPEKHRAASDAGESGHETLHELKLQRSKKNSPIHSNSGSPDLARDKRNGASGDASGPRSPDSGKQQGALFSRWLPFSLPSIRSYHLHDRSPTQYAHQKRDSVALNGSEDQGTILPPVPEPGGGGGNSITMETEDGEPLKKFTAYPDRAVPEDETTEACCKVM